MVIVVGVLWTKSEEAIVDGLKLSNWSAWLSSSYHALEIVLNHRGIFEVDKHVKIW